MRKKTGFTLAEIVIFLTIAAIVTVSAYYYIKPKKIILEKKIRYNYASAFNTLELAWREVTSFKQAENTSITPNEEEEITFFNPFAVSPDITDPRVNKDDIDLTGSLVRTHQFEKACRALVGRDNENHIQYYTDRGMEFNPASVINTNPSDEIHCDAPFNADNITVDTDFNELTPTFVTPNGMKYYLTDFINIAANEGYWGFSENVKFFIMFVDIFGKDYPSDKHTLKYYPNTTKPTFVHAFALLDTGDVIPLGPAEADKRILPTRVEYIADGHIAYTEAYGYADAKNKAYGFYNSLINNSYKKNVGYTYNDKIKIHLSIRKPKMHAAIYNMDGIAFRYQITTPIGQLAVCRPAAGSSALKTSCSIVPSRIKRGALK